MSNTATIDFTNPQELTRALIENLPAGRFLSTNFFGEEIHGTEAIAIDVLKGTRTLAPFKARGSAAEVDNGKDFETKLYNTVMIALKRPTTASQLLRRNAGEQVFYVGGPSTPAERAAARLAYDQAELANKVLRTIEKFCADALVNDSFVPGGSLSSLDFGRSATHDYDVSDKGYIYDLEKAADLIALDSGLTATDVIMGSDYADGFLADTKVQKVLDSKNINPGIIAPNFKIGNGGRLVGTFGGLRIWRYDESFATVSDETTTVSKMIPADKCLVISDLIRATVHYGIIDDVKGGMFASKMFSKTWEQDDPSVQYVAVKSAPLPVVHQPDGAVVITKTSSAG